MMRTFALFAALALAATAAPLLAEMTHAEMALANRCKALTPAAMMRDRACVALMKRYPESMTASPDMMRARPPR